MVFNVYTMQGENFTFEARRRLISEWSQILLEENIYLFLTDPGRSNNLNDWLALINVPMSIIYESDEMPVVGNNDGKISSFIGDGLENITEVQLNLISKAYGNDLKELVIMLVDQILKE